MRLFKNTKYVAIVACASIGAVRLSHSKMVIELTNTFLIDGLLQYDRHMAHSHRCIVHHGRFGDWVDIGESNTMSQC